MIITVLLLICVYNMKFMPLREFNKDYLSRETTTAIKGIFVFLVFMSHFSQYYPLGAVPGDGYYTIRHHAGQLVVTMFLFYSGYGIFESVKRKGTDYVKTFPKNRILKTLLHLDIAIVIYIIIDLIIGVKLKVPNVLLSLIGWTSIGNSNWFMFAIIVQYAIVFIAFMIFRKRKFPALITVTALSVVYMLIMSRFKENYWYNTALCLPLGMWYSQFKDKIEKVITKNNIIYFIFIAVFAVGFFCSSRHSKNIVCYEIWMLTFTMLVVMISMKINTCNKILVFLGNHVFSVYILQRIPMNIFTRYGVEFKNINLCFAVCFAITLVLAALFDKATGALDGVLFKPEKKSEIKDKVLIKN